MFDLFLIYWFKLFPRKCADWTKDRKGRRRPICCIEMDGIDMSDYPKFCDAYIDEAYWADTWLLIDEEDLNYIKENDADLIYKHVQINLY